MKDKCVVAASTDSTGFSSQARGRRPTSQVVGRMGQPSKGPTNVFICPQLGQVNRV